MSTLDMDLPVRLYAFHSTRGGNSARRGLTLSARQVRRHPVKDRRSEMVYSRRRRPRVKTNEQHRNTRVVDVRGVVLSTSYRNAISPLDTQPSRTLDCVLEISLMRARCSRATKYTQDGEKYMRDDTGYFVV